VRTRRRLAADLLVAALIALGVCFGAQAAGILDNLEQRAVAARFEVRGASVPDDVALVLVDDKSFAELERQWPFPRSLHATAVDALRKAGAREVVYDVQFTEPTTEREDGALYAALERAGGAVLATSESDRQGRTNVLGGDENLKAIGAVAAAANLPDDLAGVVDHFPPAIGRLRSLATVAAERSGGPRLPRSAFGEEGAWIDFRGPPGTIPAVSFSALVDGRVDPALLRDRIVVVGASAPSLGDVHTTPTADAPMAGPEIQGNAIWTALHGLPLRSASPAVDLALLVLMALVVPLLRLRLRVVPAALAGVVIAAAFLGGAQLAFEVGTVTWVAAPLLALGLATALMVVVSHLHESMLRRRVARDNDVLEGRVRERTTELRETQLEILQRLSRAAEWRDEDTAQHVNRIGILTQRLGRAIGMTATEAETLGNAAIAHDIGKIGIPDGILLKPGPLTTAERAVMERHVLIGASMLDASRSPVMQLAEEIARSHHERWDGTGYPFGLAGDEIPLPGRICGICDVFDALVSARPYKEAWPVERALAELAAQRGRHFDPSLVDVFIPLARELFDELYGGTGWPAQGRRVVAIEETSPAVRLLETADGS
jgi:response regulator RpfG family c-di-GMP phosphodiesterase